MCLHGYVVAQLFGWYGYLLETRLCACTVIWLIRLFAWNTVMCLHGYYIEYGDYVEHGYYVAPATAHMARLGLACQCLARLGLLRLGLARLGLSGLSSAQLLLTRLLCWHGYLVDTVIVLTRLFGCTVMCLIRLFGCTVMCLIRLLHCTRLFHWTTVIWLHGY